PCWRTRGCWSAGPAPPRGWSTSTAAGSCGSTTRRGSAPAPAGRERSTSATAGRGNPTTPPPHPPWAGRPGRGAGRTPPGVLNLPTGAVIEGSEISLAAGARTRGTLTMDNAVLEVQSLIIGDAGIGIFNWNGGSIGGVEHVSIGKQAGSEGRLDLNGLDRF